jgi:3-phosphoshikimate 1-carboxyvinyltransferase
MERMLDVPQRPASEKCPGHPLGPGEEPPLRVDPMAGLRGTVSVPGDKSISHRALIFGALSETETRIRNLSDGEDVKSTRRCLEMLGARVRIDGDAVRIQGWGSGTPEEPADRLDAGNSGTTLRLLSGLVSAHPVFSVLTGDASLRGRPMDRVVSPLRQMGAEIWGRAHGRFAPLAIRGGDLHPIQFASPVASAQVKSAILLAGLFLRGETRVMEPRLSRDHSERMLKHMGASIRRDGTTVTLEGGARLRAEELIIAGDPSSAAFFLVAGLICPDSDLWIRQICVNPTRVGYLRVLKRMGAQIERGPETLVSGEPVADLRVVSCRLRGTDIEPGEIPSCIDEIPILCVAAACAEGTTRIRGARELRVKESDRIDAMVRNLSAMGIPVQEEPDGMVIEGKGRVESFRGDSMGDHRIALSLWVAALAAPGPCEISGASCVKISFPGFAERLAALGSH